MSVYTSAKFEELENTTARVIYYSCLDKPKTIPEIAELWDYKTANYFYQRRQRKLFFELRDFGLISFSGQKITQIRSNYDLLFADDIVATLFKRINGNLSLDIIDKEYDYKISREVLQNEAFKEVAIEQKQLKNTLERLLFNADQINNFVSLWKNPLFKKIFLSSEFIKTLYKDRNKLRVDPLDFIYNLVVSLCEDINCELETQYIIVSFYSLFTDYLYLDDKSYTKLTDFINLHQKDREFKSLISKIFVVYDILKKKVEIYGEEEIEERPNMSKFVKNLLEMRKRTKE